MKKMEETMTGPSVEVREGRTRPMGVTEDCRPLSRLFRVDGEFDGAKVVELHKELFYELAMGSRDLILDLSCVEALDVTAIVLLVGTNNSCKKAGGRLLLRNVGEKLFGTLSALGLDKRFEIEATNNAAGKHELRQTEVQQRSSEGVYR